MYQAEVILNSESGLHARPASVFVKTATKYKASINVIKNDSSYNGKSIMSILSMGALKGDKLLITAEGEDEIETVESLKKLVESNFGE